MAGKNGNKLQIAAGGAAAAAAMYLAPGGTSEAQAVIVHVTTPLTLVNNGSGTQPDVPWDVDGNATIEWNLHSSLFFSGFYLSITGGVANNRFVNRVGATEDGIEGLATTASQFDVGPNLPAGYFFGAGSSQLRTMMYVGPGAGSFGPDAMDNGVAGVWAAPTQFVAFQFQGTTGVRFGWASLTLDLANDTIRVNEWAYENTGAPIHVGTVPEPGTSGLALLACGAAGLRRWHRPKRAVA